MVSCKQVEKRYNKMLANVIERTNKINCYTCKDCKTVTKTIDADNGVTPFILKCALCNGECNSSFYNDLLVGAPPTMVFYRPSLKRTIKYRKDPDTLEHILAGGLILASVINDKKIDEKTNIVAFDSK